MNGRHIIGARSLLVATTALLLVGGPAVVRLATASPAEPASPPAASIGFDVPDANLGELDRLISVFAARAPQRGESLEYRTLGEHLLARARIEGDIADYVAADDAFASAIALYPGDLASLIGRSKVALATHDFVSALALAEAVLDEEPQAYDAVAVASDAALAVGDDDTARFYIDELLSAAGADPAVMVRQAQYAFETGDLDESMRIAESAVAAALDSALTGRRLAFFQTYAAHVAFETGDLEGASRHITNAIESGPHEPATLSELGRIEAARGDLQAAIRAYEAAIAIQPQPSILAAVGDLYALQGDASTADDRYATVEAIATLAAANEQAYNRAHAQYLADHGLDPELAVGLAGSELEWRRDASGYDTYAWALYRAGRHLEALDAVETALAIGPRRAPVLYHAGLIHAALGDDAEAAALLGEALVLNAVFDPLQARNAVAVLEAVS